MAKTQGKKTKKSIIKLHRGRRPLLVVMALFFALAFVGAGKLVYADKYDAQINALQDKNSSAQDSLDALIGQAHSYQDAISKLRSQINSLNQAIADNQAKQTNLEHKIEKTKREIKYQRGVLGQDIRAMYVDGQMSTIEMIATSKNLSDFVDKSQYRYSVQSKIQDTLDTINALQASLKTKKKQVEQLLDQEHKHSEQLSADKNKLDSMLSYNQSQQANFKNEISKNKKQIAHLQHLQAILNSVGTTGVYVPASGGSGGLCDVGYGNGGYPMQWCDRDQDTVRTSFHDDPGNYTNRECTSFAFWYFTSVEGNSNFSVGYGGPHVWLDTSNYDWGYTPKVGAIGVRYAGYWGHVLIVKAVPGQTFGGHVLNSHEIGVYEMNYDYNGHFRAAIKDLNVYTINGYIYSH